MKVNVLERKGNNALLEIENDVKNFESYTLVCALNFQFYKDIVLYDNKPNESVVFSVSSQAPKEAKDELLQIARKYFNSL